MVSDILIFDKSGSENGEKRRDMLVNRFKALGLTARNWDERQSPKSGSLILAHTSDFMKSTEASLRVAAEAGATVVLYTSGSIDSGVEQLGNGKVYKMQWQKVSGILDRLPMPFELTDFDVAAVAVSKRDVLNAIAILARCLLISSQTASTISQQKLWRTEPEKWREALKGCTADDVVMAVGVAPVREDESSRNFPDELSELGVLVDWVWPKGKRSKTPSPDFKVLLKQMEKQFGFRT